MADELGTYSFLPWLRHGIANSIGSADLDQSVKLRATIPVQLTLTGRRVGDGPDLAQAVDQNVQLYGPGDITGIDEKVIIKHEPRNWSTDFEPNYLAYIDFYEEDFPWRYTPAAPDTNLHRLRPWLALVVLKESEFEDSANPGTRPLPAFNLTGSVQTAFPPADQLWAWSHVHINRDVIDDGGTIAATAMDPVLDRFENVLSQNRDHAYSRIVAPRKLDPEMGYHAFLIPTFESGRLAGLGMEADLGNAEFFATLSAWADYTGRPEPAVYPIYHRWYFKTGEKGDFEYLVRLLKARPPDSRLGVLEFDTQNPGSNISGIAESDLGGMLRLGGALKVPEEALSPAESQEANDYETWDAPYPHAFQRELAAFVNLAEDYAENPPDLANANAVDLPAELQTDEDPLITPPIYGRWHSLTERLLFEADGSNAPQRQNWVHDLNLKPEYRVPAGYGTGVVQKNQEAYMDAAWGQVGDILEANRRIRQALVAREVSAVWYGKHLEPLNQLSAARGLVMSAPMQRRIVSDGRTVYRTVDLSLTPRAAMSPTMRRILRPRDHVAVRLSLDRPNATAKLVDKLNDGLVLPAPPKTTPPDLPIVENVGDALEPGLLPPLWREWLQKNRWAKWLLLAISVLLAILFYFVLGIVPAAIALAAGVALFFLLRRLERQADTADAVKPEGNAPETIDNLPNLPGFEIRDPSDAPEPTPGGVDSDEAIRFKAALKDVYRVTSISAALGREPKRPRLDIAGLATATFMAIDPKRTIPQFTFGSVILPAHIVEGLFETFQEAMAYPKIDKPMYKELSKQQFLPNIEVIPDDTITILETNQRFIEAYMVGLNHEMARELLFREFPTDQRGSYFRQFWDPSNIMNTGTLADAAFRERLYDIPELHLWSKFSDLGGHDNREIDGEIEEEISVVVRGKVLKRYPNAVIYAHRAAWQLTEGGEINVDAERVLDTTGSLADKVKTPIYEAKVDPDINFFGFDLTAEEVKGGSGAAGDEDSGWFIVIGERQGEPRFGLDIEREGELNVWNDLAWPDVLADDHSGFLQIRDDTPTLTLEIPDAPDQIEKVEQFDEDQALHWHRDTNSAELAYILHQVPVLVAVHGSEMLRS